MRPGERRPLLISTFFNRTIAGLRWLAAALVVAAFTYMTVAVLAQVFGRYFFNYSISWTEETARYAQIWVVLIGAGITMRRGMHVAVDVLAARLPLALARGLSIVIAAACLWFLGVVAYGSMALIELGWLFEMSPVLQLPMWIIYLSLPIGAAYWALEIVLKVVERWHQPFGLRPAESRE